MIKMEKSKTHSQEEAKKAATEFEELAKLIRSDPSIKEKEKKELILACALMVAFEAEKGKKVEEREFSFYKD